MYVNLQDTNPYCMRYWRIPGQRDLGKSLPSLNRLTGQARNMYIFENEISLGNRPILDEYLDSYEYRSSGMSFTSMYMWRNINTFRWDIIGEYMWVSGMSYMQDGTFLPFLFPPMTRTGSYDKESLRESIYHCKEIFEKKGLPFSIWLIPENMTDEISAACPEMDLKADRANYDYIYLTEDLKNLRGRAYHAKKNHLNFFKKNFEYEYATLTSDMTDEVMKYIAKFNARKEIPLHEMELLEMEEEAMYDVFQNFEKAGYHGGAILIDGRIEALAAGGRLGKETMTEHIEKANVQYRGLYPAMNNEFCLNVASEFKYINREEDMGIENLRKAKLSYKPVKILEKYIGTFK